MPWCVLRVLDVWVLQGKRIKMYHSNVNSILDYYACVGRRISGARSPDVIYEEVRGFLNGAIPCDMSGAPPRQKLPSPEEAQVLAISPAPAQPCSELPYFR